MSGKQFFPLLFIFPVLLVLVTAPMSSVINASTDGQEFTNIPQQGSEGQIQQQGQGQPQCITAPCPGDDDDDGDDGDDGIPTEPDGGTGGTPPNGNPPGTTSPPFPSGRNTAESNQVGGIGAGEINQNAQGAVNDQLCSTIGGIGNRQCTQSATPGASNLQDCTAIAGLGKANCVQSENPSGPDTCLRANGQPFICETGTGTSLSGSGQAGQ